MQHFHNQISLYLEFLLESFKSFIYFLKIDPISQYIILASMGLGLILAILPKGRGKKIKSATDFTQEDINTIAGEDVIATQLDLAKAYLEMDNKPSAKKMLKLIAKQGNNIQREEAKQLMKAL